MGETRVDLLHLLEDLRDAYPGAAEETILTEIVANAIDSGAAVVTFTVDPVQGAPTILDDGGGMRRRDLPRYHDVAATTKVRGEGIGFAGVGIKIGLLVSEEVLTETRRARHHAATTWHLSSRHRAPWKWIPPPGLVADHGTAVRLRLKNPLSPLLDPGFIEGALRRHFQPLLDPDLSEILAEHYPRGVRLAVNGRPLAPEAWQAPERTPIAVRLPRRRKPAASGYLVRDRLPLREERRGLAISTFGKVIKRGWEWLGLAPSSPDRVGGLIEVPALAQALTLNKADFIRTGPRGAVYLAYRKAIQESVAHQLAEWGDLREAGAEAHRRAAPARGVAEPATSPSQEGAALSAGGTRRPARYGLSIQFEPRPDDPELARLVETTVWINEAHPAYRRAMASRSEGYHIALGTAMALAPLAVEPAKEHAFLTTFLPAGGAALERRGARRRK